MNNSFSLLFYIKKYKKDSNGKADIYLRITLNGKRSESSIRRKILINNWNTNKNIALGNSSESKEINQYLTTIKNKIYSIQQNFEHDNKSYSTTNLRDAYVGKDQIRKVVLEIFQDHNNEVQSLIGNGFAKGTSERYRTCKKHVLEF